MNFTRGLPAALIGAAATIVLVQPQMAQALEPSEISARAKEITVRIDGPKARTGLIPNTGSGVIFERTGNTYSVLTNWHVVETKGEYHVTAPDGKKYTVPYSQVKYLRDDVDLAVLQFTSNQSYRTAELGNSDKMREGNKVYVAGWGVPFPGSPERSYQFLVTNISSIVQKPDLGYAIEYKNSARPGTSGGPLLDSNARLVGINGESKSEPNTGNTFGFGIPLQIFLPGRNNLQPAMRRGLLQDFVSRAQQLVNAGDYRGAIAEYNQALESEPNNFKAYYLRGVAYVLLNNFQAAIADFNQAIRLNPNNADVYCSRGYARGEQKDYQEAISDYNEAIRLNPNYAEAYMNRGAAYRKVKDYQNAISDYSEAIRLNPDDVEAYNNRGFASGSLGEYQNAISDYSEAIRLNPDDVEAYNNRGFARGSLGDYKGAIEDYDKAIRLDPNLAGAYYGRGFARGSLGDYKGAIEDYDKAIRLNPDDAEAYYNRGNVRFNLKDYQTAISDYNEAIRLNPNYDEAYYGRGNAHRQLGDKQRAIADFQKAADLFRQQARKDLYQDALNRIRELQQ